MKVFRWQCPLESCNQEQGPLQPSEDDCKNAFEAHLGGHAASHFVPFVLAGQWRATYSLTEDK